jgi:hypothetical protein
MITPVPRGSSPRGGCAGKNSIYGKAGGVSRPRAFPDAVEKFKEKPMEEEQRTTSTRERDEPSGAFYLQGVEETTLNKTNVFGDGDFVPVAATRKRLSYEAEVAFAFEVRADDDKLDYSDVFRFRLWMWSLTSDGAKAEILMGWQDFNGDDPPGAEYGWDQLIRAAVDRLRRARSERQMMKSEQVGAP